MDLVQQEVFPHEELHLALPFFRPFSVQLSFRLYLRSTSTYDSYTLIYITDVFPFRKSKFAPLIMFTQLITNFAMNLGKDINACFLAVTFLLTIIATDSGWMVSFCLYTSGNIFLRTLVASSATSLLVFLPVSEHTDPVQS